MQLITTCLFGLEKFVGEDIDRLGYKRLETIDGRVTFEAPPEAIAACNVNFRYSERVYIALGSFPARTFTELFDGTKNLPWEDFIGHRDAFPVKGSSIRSALFSLPDCQSIVKKAVVDRLSLKHKTKTLDESGIKYQISFFIFNDRATLMIDTSGEPLYKRGYRRETGIAPIRETLAAAMINLSRPRSNVLTLDPMCGSGTIPIEAALIATENAPGINHRFAAEDFPFIPKNSFAHAREAARAAITPPAFEIAGSDIDPGCIATAQANAGRAGMDKFINFRVQDALKYCPEPEIRGTVVCNPPYGERMGDAAEAASLAKKLGTAFAQNIPSWQLYIISSDQYFENHFGRRADKTRKLYNGMLKCNLYQFFKKR